MQDLMEFLGFYNPLNNNYSTVYIILTIIIFTLMFLPEKLNIFSAKGMAILSMVLATLVIAHEVPFIKQIIPYF